MKYKIVRTDKADEQLREIIFYIADDSGSVDIALNYLDKIEKSNQPFREFSYVRQHSEIFYFAETGLSGTYCGEASCIL